MTGDVIDEEHPRRRQIGFARLRRVLLVVALLLLAALTALWTQRKEIARGYADRFLAGQKVPGRYTIADIGFNRQRLTNVVLGDPRRPDLVADWVELDTVVGVSGAQVTGVRAGRVRMRARLVNGALSFGALDRLLPKSSGASFSLPAIRADIADARMRVEAPEGVAGAKLSGRGLLSDGFAGRVALVTDRWNQAGCVISRGSAALGISVSNGRPRLSGPINAGEISCGDAKVQALAVTADLTFGAQIERWSGNVRLATGALGTPAIRAASLAGRIDFDGTRAATKGTAKLDTGRFDSAYVSGERIGFAGSFSAGQRIAIAPTSAVDVEHAALAPATLSAIERTGAMDTSTPVGPIVAHLTKAIVTAGRSFGGFARIGWEQGGALRVSQIVASSASGVNAALNSADIRYDPARGDLKLAGALAVGGGGLPAFDATLAQDAPGTAITGVATLREPYAAGDARLMLAPLRFSATPGGNTHVETVATLSGPLAGGRVEELRAPLSLYWNGRDRVIVNPSCTPVSARRVAVSGLVLDPARLSLCPQGAGLMTSFGGHIGGGARLAAARLTGTMGGTPLSLAASGGVFRLSDRGFALSDVAARLGASDHQTRLDFARIEGHGLSGRFSGGDGQIANVPLLLSAATGTWAFGRDLTLDGALTVSDAQTSAPRFKPFAAEGVTLRLAGSAIDVTGGLFEPGKHVAIASVAIHHDLGKADGHADLTIPGITFGKDFQPDAITPLTYGVIADVKGVVSGTALISWDKQGVRSIGDFGTGATDLAAAFGTVAGISGTLHFTDLLQMQTAPGQIVRVKTINPGVPVSDGTIRLQLLPGTRVQIEDGRWPFAGGALVLEPTLLDFAQPVERRMTFRVTDMDAGLFLQQFDFKNLDATGTFAGVLPMIFDNTGGRIENGSLSVTSGEGGAIAYVGEVSQKDLGFWGNLAFQSLKSLRYRRLGIEMNGPLAGEMITQVRFAGVGQGKGAKRNFLLDRLQKLPLVFNVTIRAPFRQLIDSAQSFYDPKRLIERNLPALLEEQNKKRAATPNPVQPPASETKP